MRDARTGIKWACSVVPALLSLASAAAAQTPAVGVRQLEPVSEYWDYFPHWAPDGAKIAFSSTRAAHPVQSLFIVDVQTGAVEQITHSTVAPGDREPRWSPDGAWIAFTANRDGNADVFVVRRDGSDVRNLTRNRANDAGFDWSPDGSRILFGSNRDGGSALYTMAADGSDVRRVTDLTGNTGSASWSPDGSTIAFEWDRGDGNWELYTIPAEGGDPTRVTWHWAWDGHPTWAPDGRRLAFWSDRDDFWFEIYVMDADGANVRRRTRSHDWDLNPDWSPDGRQIAWHSARGRYGIEVINVDGTGRRRLTSAGESDFVGVVRELGVDSALAAHHAASRRDPGATFFYAHEIWVLIDELLALGDTDGAVRLGEFHVDLVTRPRGDSRPSAFVPYYAYEGLGRVYRAAGRPAAPGFAEFFNLIRTEGVARARARFDDARRRFPGWSFFSEFRMNRLGYEYLNRGWIDEAIGLFEMNTLAYPASANTFDSLAEAYLRAGDRGKAITTYEKVVAMDADGPAGRNAARMLERLRQTNADPDR